MSAARLARGTAAANQCASNGQLADKHVSLSSTRTYAVINWRVERSKANHLLTS